MGEVDLVILRLEAMVRFMPRVGRDVEGDGEEEE